MICLTRAQRVALKQVFDRKPIFVDVRPFTPTQYHCVVGDQFAASPFARRMTYREFRKSVVVSLGCDGVAMAPWAGMWLGIERDGYTHS